MIATVSKVGKLRNALAYIRNPKKGGQIILSKGIDPNMPTKVLAAALTAAHNPKYKVVAHSIIISHGEDDSKEITPKQETIALKKFLKEMQEQGVELDSSPWMIAKHTNTKHLHYHMLIMGTRYDYGRFDDYYLGARATRAAARVSRLHKMQTAPKADANLDIVRETKEDKDAAATRMPRKKKKEQKKQDEQNLKKDGFLTEGASKKTKRRVFRKAAIAAAINRKENERNERIQKETSERLQPKRQTSSEIKTNRNIDNDGRMDPPKRRSR